MSSRNRPRGGHNGDADEERRLWKEIKDRAEKADEMIARSNAIGHEIIDIETQQAKLVDQGKLTDLSLNEKLENLYRENLKLCEDIGNILTGTASETNLLDSINILAGLREASTAEQAVPVPAPRPSGKRDRPKKGSKPPVEEEDPAPSPRVGSRKEKPSRAGSISTTREASVKIEDPETSSIDIPGKDRGSRLAFKTGDFVLYKHRDKTSEGEGILCRVTAVIGEGKQRRYEIQDVDNDGAPGPGGKSSSHATGSSFRASINHLMQIPEVNERLPDLAKGKLVLALYPETTTFYRGEVGAPWKAKEGSENVQIRFDGEVDNVESQAVERRYVLVDK